MSIDLNIEYGYTTVISGNHHITRFLIDRGESIRCSKCNIINKTKHKCWWFTCCNTNCNNSISKTIVKILEPHIKQSMCEAFQPCERYQCYKCNDYFRSTGIRSSLKCPKCKTKHTVSYSKLQKIYPKLKINKNIPIQKTKMDYMNQSLISSLNQKNNYKQIVMKNKKLEKYAEALLDLMKGETLV